MKKHYRHENDCLNCGTTLEGKFCHNCGQENLQIKESFGHMMNHAISDYFHFDHQFFHTLKPLLFKPGYLTNEYMAGRRVQYLHPVKMYIFISLVYFLLLFQGGHQEAKENNTAAKPANTQKVIDSVNREIANDKGVTAEQKKQIIKYEYYGKNYVKPGNSKIISFSGDTTYKQYVASQNKLPANKRDGFFSRKMTERILNYREKYGSRMGEVFEEQMQHNAPKMMFVLLPILALIVAITFRKNKKYYVEHLIYVFHLYCFLFLFFGIIMLIEMVIPDNWHITTWLTFLAILYTIWYVFRSLREVYHRNRLRTVTKLIGMSISYSIVALIGLVLLVVVTALTAS
jgi:hypothetical protein